METKKTNKITVERLWEDFLHENPDNKIQGTPFSFYFCDNKKDADECAELVVKGIKKATATSLWWYNKNNEKPPKIMDQFIVTDWDGNAKAIIEITKVELIPFHKISAEFAETEGEGDKTLSYWQKVHKAYYTREMEPYGDSFDEKMMVVCEYFKTIYIPNK